MYHQNCPAHGRCSAEPQGCAKQCGWYNRLFHQYQLSEIPRLYRGAWFRRWEPGSQNMAAVRRVAQWVENFEEFMHEGCNVYLYPGQRDSSGGTGLGKTYTAAILANEFIFSQVKHVADTQLVQFWSVPDALGRMRDTFNNPDSDFMYRWRNSVSVPLLILDDIGAEKPSEWVQEQLTWLINERVNHGHTTIYTSNYSLAELEGRLGPRLVSRIHHNLVAIPYYGTDRRRTSG